MTRNPLVGILCGLALVLGLASSAVAAPASTASVATAQPDAAAQPVDQLQQTLLVVMKHGGALGYKGRYRKLDPVVRKAFDFPFIAHMILGSDWDKLNDDQRRDLIEALARLSVSSYAKEFDSYSDQRFDYAGTQDLAGGKLERYVFFSGSDRIHFDYQMHQSGGAWKIANVVVDGVSDLALKRGQYRKLYSEKGYTGLMAWINRQIAGNAAGKSTA